MHAIKLGPKRKHAPCDRTNANCIGDGAPFQRVHSMQCVGWAGPHRMLHRRSSFPQHAVVVYPRRQFPEHTLESYRAAIEMGAGIIECDVAVTKDGQLVCRHSQCDLHTTTNILTTSLASKCSEPFSPATPDKAASAKCCTSDLTLSEFKSLCGKMDAAVGSAMTAEEYQGGTAGWRTDLYSTDCPTVVTHLESIELIKAAGRKATPELKHYTQHAGMPSYDAIRRKIAVEYINSGVPAEHVWLQSFEEEDVEYWVSQMPSSFGKQAVFLIGSSNGYDQQVHMSKFNEYKAKGFPILAPPQQLLVKPSGHKYAPSPFAEAIKAHGFDIITWTLERSGHLGGGGGWYYGGSADHPVNSITNNDGDMLELTHVLAKDVGVLGVFSDWPATTTFYASCMMDRPKVTCGPKKPCPSGFECSDGSRRARKLLFASGPKGKGECVKAY